MHCFEHECRELPHRGLTTNYTPDSVIVHKKSLNTNSYIEKKRNHKKMAQPLLYISTKQKEKI